MNTVAELVEYLQQNFDPSSRIIMSKDAEGNEFMGVADLSEVFVEKSADLHRFIDVFDEEDIFDGYEPEEHDEVRDNFEKVVVIWPI